MSRPAPLDPTIPNWMRAQPLDGCDAYDLGVGRDSHCDAPHDWPGVKVPRFFSLGPDSLDALWKTIQWERTDIRIDGGDGKPVFEMSNCEFPDFYSPQARQIIASKYFIDVDTGDGPSMRNLVARVVNRIVGWGLQYGYYDSEISAENHRIDLAYLLINQYFSFNSPVWFNFGVKGVAQQGSACFIVPVGDSLDEIDEWCRVETRIFKRGSGSGADVSRLRSSYEKLSVGGYSSGPVPFMKVADTKAGAIKSAGTTRRAAKMVTMYVGHPDILQCRDGSPGFIRCKVEEEKRAHILIDNGVSGEFNVPHNAYENAHFQNANHSVRVCDAFMEKATQPEGTGDLWHCMPVNRREGPDETIHRYEADKLLREIAEATWFCGDPGLQYASTINLWNTCKNSGTIYASNPCSEYLWFDDTACNLASIKLTRFRLPQGGISEMRYIAAIRHIVLAMEIIVAGSDYPTPSIARQTRRYRNLGLGHADLGALLMQLGIAYDSDRGRNYAATLSSLMTAAAYNMSAEIARDCGGPFVEWEKNKDCMADVLARHMTAKEHKIDRKINRELWSDGFYFEVLDHQWKLTMQHAEKGFRNANSTLHAPTGTIAFLMDCDTTGIEPELGLVKFKKLVGGGVMKIVPQSIREGLEKIGWTDLEANDIAQAIERGESVNTLFAPDRSDPGSLRGVKARSLALLQTAFGENCLSAYGHLDMVAAIQPHISMGISKTINLPNTATVKEIEQIYIRAWKAGVKCVSVYRDGCKRSQPLSTKEEKPDTITVQPVAVSGGELPFMTLALGAAHRRKLPNDRNAITHKFQVGDQKGYLTVGLYEDGTPGEIFISMSKEGSTISGVLDSFATAISFGLQYGVPLSKFCDKFSHVRFEPSGWTGNPDIPMAKSIIDYIFRWMANRFLPTEVFQSQRRSNTDPPVLSYEAVIIPVDRTGPPCPRCHSQTIPAGKCHVCTNCGETSGCG